MADKWAPSRRLIDAGSARPDPIRLPALQGARDEQGGHQWPGGGQVEAGQGRGGSGGRHRVRGDRQIAGQGRVRADRRVRHIRDAEPGGPYGPESGDRRERGDTRLEGAGVQGGQGAHPATSAILLAMRFAADLTGSLARWA